MQQMSTAELLPFHKIITIVNQCFRELVTEVFVDRGIPAGKVSHFPLNFLQISTAITICVRRLGMPS